MNLPRSLVPLTVASVLAGSGSSALLEAQLSVADIRAHPFCEAEGRLASQDLLSDPPPTLWNAIIGAGQLECATRATLVVVVLTAPSHQYLGRTALVTSLTFQRQDGDSTYTVEHRLGISSYDGRYYMPVWLKDTGCDPVRIRAWIKGRESEARDETIQFACGE